jgi:hypothetical protein
MKDIHVDHTTHQLVVDRQKGTAELGRVVTELHGLPKGAKADAEASPTGDHSDKAGTDHSEKTATESV